MNAEDRAIYQQRQRVREGENGLDKTRHKTRDHEQETPSGHRVEEDKKIAGVVTGDDDDKAERGCCYADKTEVFNQDEVEETSVYQYSPRSYLEKVENIQKSSLKVYKYRWLILFTYSMNTMINAVIFTGLSPISNIASKYYNVSPVLIDWLSNSFMLAYVIFALPAAYMMFKYGLRPLLIFVATMHSISMLLRYLGHASDGFRYILLGQCFGAIAFGILLQIPGQLSSSWFPENERSKATSIAISMNIFGVAVGFLQSTILVKNSTDMHVVERGLEALFVTQLAFTVFMLLLTIFSYREKPPTPPSRVKELQDLKFNESLKCLYKNRNFILMSQSYAIYYALLVAFTVFLNPLVTTVYLSGYERKIGWMGFTGYVASICSCVIVGLWLDKSHEYQMIARLLNGFSALAWFLFVFILTQTNSFVSLFVYFSVVASLGVPYFSTGIEQAAEMTYPVPEIISSTVILILGNLYAFLLLLCLGFLLQAGFVRMVCYIVLALYVISTIISCFTHTELKRKHAEDDALKD